MITITIHDAKTNLSKYIAAAKKGEKIYIGGYGKAEVVLTKLPTTTKREFGFLKGRITMQPDAFSEETDAEIAKLMLGD